VDVLARRLSGRCVLPGHVVAISLMETTACAVLDTIPHIASQIEHVRW
jgi:hypothetical protein